MSRHQAFYMNRREAATFRDAITTLRRIAHEHGVDAVRQIYATAISGLNWNDYLKTTERKEGSSQFPRLAGKDAPERPPGADHTVMLNKDGKPHTYISEPYHFTLDTMRETVTMCDSLGLDCAIQGFSFWFPDNTMLVQYTRQDELPHFLSD